jgi:Holliday junction resolvase RusA-like endonuclease
MTKRTFHHCYYSWFVPSKPQTYSTGNYEKAKKRKIEALEMIKKICRPLRIFEEDIEMNLIFWLKGERIKIDLDNLTKFLCDALTGVAYKDDSQIVKLSARKEHYSMLSGVTVEIKTYIY